MSAKPHVPPLLPVDLYDLTPEDRVRAEEEQSLGMVSPQDPTLNLVALAVDQTKISSVQIQSVVHGLFKAAGSQQQKSQKGKPRRMLVGLAAPQIGESLRIIVVDTKISLERKKPGRLECFINPEVIWRSRETAEGREGCFSAGPVWGLVRRSVAVKIRAFTPEGKQVEQVFEDFTARIVQHEIDHLQGIRFPDRIKSDKKRHWVHAEELALYPKHITRWPRLCSLRRWETFISKNRV